jgi:hypothetical protein
MGAPAHDPKLDLVGPCHLGLENDGAVGLGMDLLALVPNFLLDVTGHILGKPKTISHRAHGVL